jgi:GWxTD domain-containing protein
MVVTLSRLLPLALGLLLATPTLPELFQKAKQEFKLGSYGTALSTLERLDAESSKEGFERDRAALLPGLLFYKGAALASLGRQSEAQEAFEAFLALKPDVELDPGLYPKPVIAAMGAARKAVAEKKDAPEETGAIATAYRAFVPPAGHVDESAREDWSEGPVKWLLTAEEKRSWEGLVDPISRSEFIANFWKSRDQNPETPVNEFREEFDRRAAFADHRFVQDETRGSLTDRGMVFILIGPPTYSGTKRLRTGEDTADESGLQRYTPAQVNAAGRSGSGSSRQAQVLAVTGPGTRVQEASNNWIEAWHFLRAELPKAIPNQELEFDFVTKHGYGKNVLQRDVDVINALEIVKAHGRKS